MQFPEEPIIKFAKLRDGAVIPNKLPENAGYDLYACPRTDDERDYGFYLYPFTTTMIPTGLIYACEKNWFLSLRERGSTGIVSAKIGAGVGDSGFRNELMVFLYNGNAKPIIITSTHEKVEEKDNAIFYPMSKGIAQFTVEYVPPSVIQEVSVEEVMAVDSVRGLGMLGSSGK